MTEREVDDAGTPGGPAASVRRLLDHAVHAAVEVPEPHLRAPLLARISALHATGDSRLAGREARDAVALAREIEDPYVRSFTLAEIAEGLTAADPVSAVAAESALRAARSVTDARSRTIALAQAAVALGVGDRQRAGDVLAEAKQLAESAGSDRRRGPLAAVLERIAVLDPATAMREVTRITGPQARGIIMAIAIPRLASDDPHRAMALAGQVPELHEQIKAWAGLCDVLAHEHPDLALRAAECAEADAGFSYIGLVQLNTLAGLARSVRRIDRVRAEQLLAAAEAAFERVDPSHSRSLAAAGLARAQACFDLERAEDTARRIAPAHPRAHAFVLLAADLSAGNGL